MNQTHPLLEPIAAEGPCGEDLEYTPLLAYLDSLRIFGQLRAIDGSPDPGEIVRSFEWPQLERDIEGALARSKDLRLLAYLAVAALRTRGPVALCEILTIAAGWLEAYWDCVYPRIDDDDDALARRSALSCLADPMAIVERLRRTPILQSPRHGRFSLRDIDIAAFRVLPAAGEGFPDQDRIDAAVAEAAIEQLPLYRAASDALAALSTIKSKMSEHGPDMVPEFSPLSVELRRIVELLRSSETMHTEVDGADAVGRGDRGTAAAGALTTITSRQDAIRALHAVAEFVRGTYPASPVPMVIERARRLLESDFIDLLAEMPPSAQSEN
jgi:type VI secretion system protein ImpA